MTDTTTHHYTLHLAWSGNQGKGTDHIRTYDRTHSIRIAGKPSLELTTDNKTVGDPSKLNPEDLLVSAIASCHMLSYLYLCALEGINILSYEDDAEGFMTEQSSGGGRFDRVILRPQVRVKDEAHINRAIELHHRAHDSCYIASSVNFQVECQPHCTI